jgi:tRNA threonylcarbamoyladenosine biosynthesis protein TsaB
VILAFDTATRATTVALCDGDWELESRDDPPPGRRPGHATRLLPLVAEVLDRAQASWTDVERIAVGVGPGTFTGLRIGIATARALARARGLPLVGVSTLQSLALGAAEHRRAPPATVDVVLAVLDARRREVFTAAWRPGAVEGAPLLAARPIAPDQLAAAIPELGSSVLAIGDGAVEFRQVLERAGALIPDDDAELHRVSAINHCRLASALRAGAPDEIQPDYLRLPDAEISRRSDGHQ